MHVPRLRELDANMEAAGAQRRQFDWRNGNLTFRVIYLARRNREWVVR